MTDETWFAKWEDEESLEYVEIVDNTVTLTDPVRYGIFPAFKGESRDDNAPILLLVVDGDESAGEGEPAATAEPVDETEPAAEAALEVTASLSAQPTTSQVLVNGEEVAFEAYNIDGSNYFKLRDLAMALNGSEKNFSVEWDAEANAITLTSVTEYAPVGNELAVSGNLASKQAIATSSSIYIDGEEVMFTAYNIDGSNYFKLRDIAKAFNIGVDWDAEAKTISINASADYIEAE